jgi:mannosyltransferase OCH1-like enzyme
MGSAPAHPLIKRALEKLKENEGVPDNYLTIMYGTGPGLITESFKEITPTSKNRTVIFPSTYFYPWPYYMRDEKDRSVIESWIKPETFGIHHWHLSWNEGKIG